MTDSIAITQSLVGLLEAESADVYDWDASALVEWPNIAPLNTAPVPPAEHLAAVFDRAH
jgi:hypothetical protein